MPRFLTLWLPRYPVQRRLLADPALRSVPVFVVRREPRGLVTVDCWGWAEPPRRADGVRPGAGSASIRSGMTLAEAFAVLAMLHGRQACERAWVDHDDPAADLAALLELARWCRRFTPAVAPETCLPEERPECLCLDVSATAAFFGGEDRLARTAVWTLAARGIHARAAIADTIGVAWAAAHHVEAVARTLAPPRSSPEGTLAAPEIAGATISGAGRHDRSAGGPRPRKRRHVVVPSGVDSALDALPAGSLRLDGETLARLAEVGIDTIGGVTRLPRRSLASRFGPLLARRLAEWSGSRAEPLDVPRDGRLPHAARSFDFPLSLRGAAEEPLVACIEELLGSCVRPLVAAGCGVTAFQVRLERPGRAAGPAGGPATPPVVVDVGLFRPSASVRHLMELVRLRLSRTRVPEELEGVAVEVVAAGPAASRQRSLFGDEETAAVPQVEQLLDRLSGRLGRAAVFEPHAVADAQPEHAWLAVPPCALAGRPRSQAKPRREPQPRERGQPMPWGGFSPAERRPFELLTRPLRLETARGPAAAGTAARIPVPVSLRVSSGGHGGDERRRRVVRAQGPERVETAWWRGPSVRRDYFVVECVVENGAVGGEEGVERWWIFRSLRDGEWFLHGIFA